MRARYFWAIAAVSLASIGPAYDLGHAWAILPLFLAFSFAFALGLGHADAAMERHNRS